MATLHAEIVSPEKRCVTRDVDMVVVPGTEGDIAAMPGRFPIMLQLRGGVVSLYENGQVVQRCFVEGGFADMGADHCTILADSVRELSDLSGDAARERLNELELAWSQLGPDASPIERDDVTHKLQVARAEMEAAEQDFSKSV
ncbi:ATP synthase F1 subunit epsilon [Oecophyllibacter saccharovorans]|uniref:ATP synthase F1 subunit epsilon n=1 Tax=Oecophyllibacter saccharovorans TaxID=2558360 RepID=UPI0011435A74|nr:ATP synthase F1 subunit epsilon [Oecophyllibacter saccharovorans]QDH15260.1 ATP synthase F1 subunit epsilon [Oecophyllibacter saccharovorans]